ncbi:peptidoglycan DD-metalloendopeptidase family protein [Flavobacterium sp.]|jgi:murein DD-endopeptidase MepM/ murein hydrolase activator NlpD|uniref:peptidoglycan DD-metalloendopeptidase family protein n=1 Tax=Flavobacterium sp. TaxID=239 RepID=UPI002A812A40|nr:peptidoglycan DD-metalloendopeptidase family protein [Flavobacterium sp.]
MKNVKEFFNQLDCAKVISSEIDYSKYVALDLSPDNSALNNIELETAQDYEKFIQNYLVANNAKMAYGGYKETRNLYKRSTVFKNDLTDERNIHIGLDLWINEAAPIYAALDGKIHSFQNNTALGDYGPVVILEHTVENFTFHTLYGHLNEDSLVGKEIGQVVKKGEQIGNLGLPPINGDYAPHLHFQIIIDMEGKKGDYAGVCSLNTLSFYSKNCPDPNWLLKIE